MSAVKTIFSIDIGIQGSLTNEDMEAISENTQNALTYANDEARIGADDFSIYEISNISIDKLENSSLFLTTTIEHNLSDEDFATDEAPSLFTHKQAIVMLSERVNNAIEMYRQEGHLSGGLENEEDIILSSVYVTGKPVVN